MSFKSLKDFNFAMLVKQAQKLFMILGNLITKLLNAKYYPNL
jgi:hypothetical protein